MTQIQPRIEPSGFPARTELVLARERQLWPIHAARVGGADPEDLTCDAVMTALTGQDMDALASGAWLVGRARVAGGDPGLGSAAERRAKKLDRADDYEALAFLEAQMSLALADRSVRKRKANLSDFVRKIDSLYVQLAAYYLAQLGDPSGWPAMMGVARGRNEQGRIVAARNLVGFLPYDGQAVGGVTIDVVGALRAGLADTSAFVRREAPALIAEAAGAGARPLIEALAASDDDEVRAAAISVLDQLG